MSCPQKLALMLEAKSAILYCSNKIERMNIKVSFKNELFNGWIWSKSTNNMTHGNDVEGISVGVSVGSCVEGISVG